MITSIISNLFNITNILLINLGMFIGIIFGAIPGLNASIGITLLLPMTYTMGIYSSIALLIGVYCGGIFGGSITAILIKTPGTSAAAATMLDGSVLADRGKAGYAMDAALKGSFCGGVLATIVLMVASPLLSKFALKFGPAEMFGLALIGLTIIPSVVGGNPIKGFLAAFLGLFVTVIGIDGLSGTSRMTFGVSRLKAGIQLVPSMIGIFAFSQVLQKVFEADKPADKAKDYSRDTVSWKELFSHWRTILRSTSIGTIIGAIPGTGPALAAFISYNEAKRASKTPEEFGKGCVDGVIAPETANNAVTGAAFIPLLSLGIPGDTATAILMGAMVISGVSPGPMFFQEERPLGIYMMIILILANIFMLLQGTVLQKLFARVTEVPMNLLIPIIGVFCILGSYAINNSLFDVWVMIVFGLIGYFIFNKFNIPKPPFIIARILGSMAETNLRRALILSDNGWLIFIQKPISLICILICVGTICYPYIKKLLKNNTGVG